MGWRRIDPVKSTIRLEYGLTSNDFGKVLEKIKSHHYLSSWIDDPLPLLGGSEEMILEFLITGLDATQFPTKDIKSKS